jgi:hypothetical protein
MKYGKCTTGTAGHSGQGYTQVLIGNAGHTYQNNWIAEDSHHFPPPSWSVFRSFQFGISHMTANLTHLEMAFIGGDAVHDSFVLETENA